MMTTSEKPKVKARERKALPPYRSSVLTPGRIAILQYLHEHKFGTTHQIHQVLQGDKKVTHTLGDLGRLRELGLLRSFLCQTDIGKRPMLCWLLREPGATAIGQRWNNQYDREPGNEQILMRDWEMEIEQDLALLRWKLVKPVHYNRIKPMPKRTVQAVTLIEGLRRIYYYRITQKGETHLTQEYNVQFYDVYVPAHCNDYVTYRQYKERPNRPGQPAEELTQLQAVAFILVPPSATRRYLKARMEFYKRLVKEMPVIAVFGTKEQAHVNADFLKSGGLGATSVVHLSGILMGYEQAGMDYYSQKGS
jgi:hypothetical protein